MSSRPDFPYYNGEPVAIGGGGWLIIVASVVVAFLLLTSIPPMSAPLVLIPAIVFTGVPLLTLALVTRGHHTALFRPFGLKELALAIGFGLLTMVFSFAVGLVLIQFVEMTPNASAAELAAIGPVDLIFFLIGTFIQLIGEELMTILPLLAVLWLCVQKLGLSRRWGLVIGVVVSTLWFAAVHLPTYNWNFVQCFGGIGSARLVLTASFLLTRNLWVCAGAHIVNDWTEFFLPMLIGGMAQPVP